MSNWICYLWEQNPVHGFNLPFVWTLSMMLMGMQQRRGAGVLMSTVAVLPSPAGGSLPGGLTYFGWSWAREISVLPLSFLMVPWANTPNFQRTLAQRRRISFCLHGLAQCITVPSDGALGWCCWEAVVFSPQRANPGLLSGAAWGRLSCRWCTCLLGGWLAVETLGGCKLRKPDCTTQHSRQLTWQGKAPLAGF